MEPLDQHVLYLAPTRPSMKWGVPSEGLVMNVAIVYVLTPFLSGGDLFWMLGLWFMCVPIHYAMRFQANRNHGFFREMRMWLRTKAAIPAGTLWCMPPSGSPHGRMPTGV